MESTTKKKLVIFTCLAIVAGVGGYVWYKHKKDESVLPKADDSKDQPKDGADTKTLTTETPTINVSTKGKVISPKGTIIPKSTSLNKPNSTADRFASTTDLLAGGLNSANGKKVYSGIATVVFNMAGAVAFRPKNKTYLGVIYKAQKTTNGKDYMLYMAGTNGVKYKLSAKGTAVKM